MKDFPITNEQRELLKRAVNGERLEAYERSRDKLKVLREMVERGWLAGSGSSLKITPTGLTVARQLGLVEAHE